MTKVFRSAITVLHALVEVQLWYYALCRIALCPKTAMEGQITLMAYTFIRKLMKPSLALCLASPLAHLSNLLASILGTYQPTK